MKLYVFQKDQSILGVKIKQGRGQDWNVRKVKTRTMLVSVGFEEGTD